MKRKTLIIGGIILSVLICICIGFLILVYGYGGGKAVMEPEIVRTNFNNFLSKYKKKPVTFIGNIPQYKQINENEI